MLLNKDEFVQCAIEAGLIVNEDWLKEPDYVNSLLIDLGKFAVESCDYLGKGIGRVAYRFRNWVIKINRDFVNVDSEYDEYEGHYDSYNLLDSAKMSEVPEVAESEGMKQMMREMNWYSRASSEDLEYVAKIYACSDNYAIQIAEYCNEVDEEDLYDDDYEMTDEYTFLSDNFSDTHPGNLGYNRDGKLVMIDLGWEI